MHRVALGIEYVGSAFAGWQTQQAGVRTVQRELEKALSEVAAHKVDLICAGRTDAGVHAREQIAHFDTDAIRSMRAWALGANTHLPGDISVSWAMPAPMHFHARYSAEGRTYRYFILNRGVRSALVGKAAAMAFRPLDHDLMARAAPLLLGHHDFSAFRSAQCQSNSPVRRLTRLTVARSGEWIAIEATANAFLHHMVRNIVGLLIAVGRGEQPPGWAKEVLESRDRSCGAATAAAEGLYFWHVQYPAAFGLPLPPAMMAGSAGLRI